MNSKSNKTWINNGVGSYRRKMLVAILHSLVESVTDSKSQQHSEWSSKLSVFQGGKWESVVAEYMLQLTDGQSAPYSSY